MAALFGVAILSAVLATRAWDHSHPRAFVAWAILAIVCGAVAAFFALPGSVPGRSAGIAAAVVLVAGPLVTTCVILPRSDASAAHDGDHVIWSRMVPKELRTGDRAGDISALTALSDERVVVTRGNDVLVIDPRDGSTVKSLTAPTTSPYGPIVGRTVDGFALQDSGTVAFYDNDGTSLNTVRSESLHPVIARAAGTTVALDCPGGPCVVVAHDDNDKELWRSKHVFDRPSTVRITDSMPALHLDELFVLPRTVLVPNHRDAASRGETIDELDPASGDVVRTFDAERAGSTLSGDTAYVFAEHRDGDQCTLEVWTDDRRDSSSTEPDDCERPAAVLGNRLIYSGNQSSRIVDLAHPTKEAPSIFPPVHDGDDQQPMASDAGLGGAAAGI